MFRLVKPDYIIEGKVDLIRGEGDTVEIVDFKSQRKPDMVKDREQLEQYRRQLHIYAHLVEERTGQKVSKMHIYYTGEGQWCTYYHISVYEVSCGRHNGCIRRYGT